MIHQTTARRGVASLCSVAAAACFVAIVTTSTPASAHVISVDPSSPVAACSLTVTGDSVPVMRDPVLVQAALTTPIGDSVTAAFPRESKVSVVQVERAAGGAPNTLQLTLNTAEALPGDWTVAMKGTTGECIGKLKVTASP